jgi:hypothetical protein
MWQFEIPNRVENGHYSVELFLSRRKFFVTPLFIIFLFLGKKYRRNDRRLQTPFSLEDT